MIHAMLNHLWQSTLWLGAAGLFALILRHHGARIRYWVWFTASVKLIVPFALLSSLGTQLAHRSATLPLESPVIAPVMLAAEQVTTPFSNPPAKLTPEVGSLLNVSSLAIGAWILGVLVMAMAWLGRCRRLRAVVCESQPLSVVAPVPVRATRSSLEPGLVGIWHPVLLMPEGLANELSREQMDAIVAHEISHLHRRDNLTFAIHMLSQTVFWFYPLTWWLGKRLIIERERACDEAVVAAGHERSVYAGSILKVCRFYVKSPLPCAAGVSGGILQARVEAIMSDRIIRPIAAATKASLIGLGVVGIAAPFAVGMLTTRLADAQSPTGSSSSAAEPAGTEIARLRYEQSRPRIRVPFDPPDFDKYVGYYQLFPSVFFHVYRTDNHYFARLTGQEAVEWFPESPNEFFATIVAAQISFVSDASGQVTGLVLHQNGRLRPAKKVSATVAKQAAADRKERIDSNKPSPGTEVALRHQIDTLSRGEPDYDSMTAELAAMTRQQLPQIRVMFNKVGEFKSLRFIKVLQSGSDSYIATFAAGELECTVAPLSAEGKISGDFFHLVGG